MNNIDKYGEYYELFKFIDALYSYGILTTDDNADLEDVFDYVVIVLEMCVEDDGNTEDKPLLEHYNKYLNDNKSYLLLLKEEIIGD